MGKAAVSIGAGTFQFFTRNPRGGAAKEYDGADVALFNEYALENGIANILAHAPYTLNCAAEKDNLRVFAEEVMRDDLERLSHIPGAMYNFHPGSHVGQGSEKGVELISGILSRVINPENGTRILLETMSGKGSEVGGTFEEIKSIIDSTQNGSLLGVCLDTCHVNDAGYDIVNDLPGVLAEFDRVIGLERLCAVHLNDSKNPFASHKDRHEKLGEGFLGIEAIKRILNHPALRTLPFYLETPNDLDGYKTEIALMQSLAQ